MHWRSLPFSCSPTLRERKTWVPNDGLVMYWLPVHRASFKKTSSPCQGFRSSSSAPKAWEETVLFFASPGLKSIWPMRKFDGLHFFLLEGKSQTSHARRPKGLADFWKGSVRNIDQPQQSLVSSLDVSPSATRSGHKARAKAASRATPQSPLHVHVTSPHADASLTVALTTQNHRITL